MHFGTILYTIILYPLVQLIEISFKIFLKLFDNSGIAVLGVSLTVTLLCLPLYIVAERWQEIERETQKKLKPGIDRIKAVFKGDEQYMILSTYYRQHHYHPIMALRSSFGLLIQIPFFMAAYTCLSSLPELQKESFLFIKDMGAPDALFYIGAFPVNILPIAMTLINIAAGAIYTKGFPLKEKIQIYGMAAIFLVLLYNSPAGLVLYWTMNNIFSLIKNIFYKLKNPLKILYILMCAGIAFVDIFILFIYSGGASMQKRLAAVIPLSLLFFTPIVVKAVNYLLNHSLQELCRNKKRTLLFLGTNFALCILAGIALPSSLITSSVQEFSDIGTFGNPASFLPYSFWQSFGIFVFWPLCIYFLFRDKIQTVLAVLFSAGLFCSLLNTYVFSGNYGSMDVTLKFIDGMNNPSAFYMAANIVCIILIFGAVILYFSKGHIKIITTLAWLIGVSFLTLGIINISQITSEYTSFQKITANATSEENDISPVYHLSLTHPNVVIFMLDRAESSYFESIIEDQPELKNALSGFTYYKNTLAYNGHTLIGTPPLYGGYEYTPAEMNRRSNETLHNKHNEALLVIPRILTEQAGFTATLTDTSWGNYSYIADMSFVDNYENITGETLRGRYAGIFKKQNSTGNLEANLENGLIRNLLWISLFRQSPVALRPVIYYKGSWWNSSTIEDMDDFIDWYAALHYLPETTDFSAPQGTVSIITNEATHSNFKINNLNLLNYETLSHPDSAGYDINTVSLMAIAEWIQYLKDYNVYDNTRIIIVADHGIGYGDTATEDYETHHIDGVEKDHFHPLFLYKDFNAQGDLETSMEFMTNADVPALALKDIVSNPKNPFTGNAINSSAKANGVYITTDDLFMPYHSSSKNIFTVSPKSWYKVSDNIFIDDNWIQEVPEL